METFEIKKILSPIDFSETSMVALDHGAEMAALYKAELSLLHVIKYNSYIGNPVYSIMLTNVSPLKLHEIATQQLHKIAQDLKKKYGIKVETLCITNNNPCKAIITTAREDKFDLIVMGTHGASGFEEFFIGSNANRVVHDAHCPVITIPSNTKKKGFTDIVVPIDHSEYSRQKVNHSLNIAKHYGSVIHILGLLTEKDNVELKKLQIKIDQVKVWCKKSHITYTEKIVYGKNLAKLTINYAKEIGSDLIIIMNEWEEDVTGVFLGPFARQIVNHSRIPVMSIRAVVHDELIPSVTPY